ncbi:MAG: glycosyltransferase family 2 protein [Bryobacteraceae bacterium]
MAEFPLVSITIVTFNSSRFIGKCLGSIAGQSYPNIQVVIVDNASADSTCSFLGTLDSSYKVIYNSENTGFAFAQNQAIEASEGRWVLALNPDVLLTSTFVSTLVAAGEARLEVGTVCGKLLCLAHDLTIPEKPLIDSTGIFLTPELRHLDRGSRLIDDGSYDKLEYVFGATGAAALYRREMIEHISIHGEFFDPDFFSYREDADVSWRAQVLGWKCLYAPAAVAYHVRTVFPGNRRELPPSINMHSVKNRWLLRIKNMTGDLYRRYWFPITLRDLIVVAACLTVEWRSLPAFVLVAKNWRRTFAKRREIMRLKRADDTYMAQWLSATPKSFPVSLKAQEAD